MKLAGKYHGSGRLYTQQELAEREAYSANFYAVQGYRIDPLPDPETGVLVPMRTPNLVLPYRKYTGIGSRKWQRNRDFRSKHPELAPEV